jgi:hypothetical protein
LNYFFRRSFELTFRENNTNAAFNKDENNCGKLLLNSFWVLELTFRENNTIVSFNEDGENCG